MTKRLEKFLDGIKDEIDDLSKIKNLKHKVEACNELIEYIQIHHLETSERDLEEMLSARARDRANAKLHRVNGSHVMRQSGSSGVRSTRKARTTAR